MMASKPLLWLALVLAFVLACGAQEYQRLVPSRPLPAQTVIVAAGNNDAADDNGLGAAGSSLSSSSTGAWSQDASFSDVLSSSGEDDADYFYDDDYEPSDDDDVYWYEDSSSSSTGLEGSDDDGEEEQYDNPSANDDAAAQGVANTRDHAAVPPAESNHNDQPSRTIIGNNVFHGSCRTRVCYCLRHPRATQCSRYCDNHQNVARCKIHFN